MKQHRSIIHSAWTPLLLLLLLSLSQCTQPDNEKKTDPLEKALATATLSLDQYMWSVAGDWRRALAMNLDADRAPDKIDPSLGNYFRAHEPVIGVVVADSNASHARVMSFADRLIPGATLGLLRDSLAARRELFGKMIDWQTDGYKRIEAIHLPATKNSAPYMALVFLHETDSSSNVITMVIDTEQFVRDIMKPVLPELAGDRFDLACFLGQSTTPICGSTKPIAEEMRIRRQLLSLPEYELGIAEK